MEELPHAGGVDIVALATRTRAGVHAFASLRPA